MRPEKITVSIRNRPGLFLEHREYLHAGVAALRHQSVGDLDFSDTVDRKLHERFAVRLLERKAVGSDLVVRLTLALFKCWRCIKHTIEF